MASPGPLAGLSRGHIQDVTENKVSSQELKWERIYFLASHKLVEFFIFLSSTLGLMMACFFNVSMRVNLLVYLFSTYHLSIQLLSIKCVNQEKDIQLPLPYSAC